MTLTNPKQTSKMRGQRTAWAVCAASVLFGCSVGPNYVRPTTEPPSAYKEAVPFKQAEPRDQEPRGPWWMVFKDPKLDALLSQVEVSNQTIKAAEARVREARALTQAARAALFPLVSANASATRSGSGGGTGNSISNTTGPSGGVRNNYNVALDVSWEVDLWGRVRRTIEASEATAQASVADLEAAKLLAQAQLAEDYFLLRVQDAQIRLLNDTVEAYQRSLQLTRNQYAVGVAARADVAQAETQLKSTQASPSTPGSSAHSSSTRSQFFWARRPRTFRSPPKSCRPSFRRYRRESLPSCSSVVRTLPARNGVRRRPTRRSVSPKRRSSRT